VKQFVLGLIPDWVWAFTGGVSALWSIWPWLVGLFLIGVLVGAAIGRWAAALLVGAVVAAFVFFGKDPQAALPKAKKRSPGVVVGTAVRPRTRTIFDMFKTD
jgi:hypothetical protein